MMVPAVAAAAAQVVGQAAASLADMYQTNKSNEFAWDKQKKVLQNQVQWRVEDAVKAGLHPLAALGMSPASGPSVAVGNAGEYLSRMGSSVSEALRGIQTPEQKAANDILMKRGVLENDLLSAQILSEKARLAQMQSPGNGLGPGVMPIPGITGPSPGGYGYGVSPDADKLWTVENPGVGQTGENNYGEPGSWIFGGAALVNDAIRNTVGSPAVNAEREIRNIVNADIWAQARADLAKTWARGVSDLYDLYQPGGVKRQLGN